ncbi:MAG: SpoIIE family protein phosphatase [Phycisphaerae bacterium]|nr:SpoIIE family protein phosphatase [Phycisphaerae bacterium]
MSLTDATHLGLTDFVDVETLQSLQDGFAELTGIATSIRDAQGNPITKPARESAFCKLIHSSRAGEEACRLGYGEAKPSGDGDDRPVASDSSCRYHCHAGLTQFVTPIMIRDRQLGAIAVGRRPAGKLDRRMLTALGNEYDLPVDELDAAAGTLKPWSESEMSAATRFVQQLAHTIAQLCQQAYELRCRVDELAALHKVSSTLAGRMGLEEILDTATKKLVETMGLKAAGLRLLDEDTGELRIASVARMSASYFDTNPILVSQSPIDREALETGKTVYVEDVRTDPRTYYKDRARKEGLVSALVTPLASGGQRIGVLRAYMGCRHRFTPLDISLLEAIASQVAAAIVNVRLRRDAIEAERLERQVKLAGQVQRRMIPARSPEHPRYRFGCVYEPSSDLAGDFYDFVELPDGDIGVVIADVVGSGVPASLMMASARSALRSHARQAPDIGELMRAVNLRLWNDTLPSEFATAFYAVLSRDGRRLRFCNAGHEPMLLLRRGEVRQLDVGGLVLGIDPAATYESGELELEPGDLLALTTDGLTEALNYDDEAYGRSRLHASLKLYGSMAPDMPANLIAKQLLWDVRRFVGLAAQSDDMTLVIVRVG